MWLLSERNNGAANEFWQPNSTTPSIAIYIHERSVAAWVVAIWILYTTTEVEKSHIQSRVRPAWSNLFLVVGIIVVLRLLLLLIFVATHVLRIRDLGAENFSTWVPWAICIFFFFCQRSQLRTTQSYRIQSYRSHFPFLRFCVLEKVVRQK